MKITHLLLQTLVAAAVVAVPLLAEAQPYPNPGNQAPVGPYGSGYPYVSSAYPMSFPSGAWQQALGGTPLDPQATTVRVVPPQGGTVMLYRNGSVRGWWMQPSMISVRPGQPYAIVATRGTKMLFNAAMVFHPGYTDIVWRGSQTPRIAYTPAWNYAPHGYGYGDAYAGHRRARPQPAHRGPAYDGYTGVAEHAPRTGAHSAPVAAAVTPRANVDTRSRRPLMRRTRNVPSADQAKLRRTAPRRTSPSAATPAAQRRAAHQATRSPSRLRTPRAPARTASNDGMKKRIKRLAARRSQSTPAASKKAVPKRTSPKRTSPKRTSPKRSKKKLSKTVRKTMRVARATR